MKLAFVIGFVVLLCSFASASNLRKRRQADFVFPDRFADFQNRGGGGFGGGGFGGGGFGGGGFGGGGFGGGFNNGFGGGFGNGNPFFGGQLPQQQQGQGRVPFPTPIQPGPPAFIDAQPQESVAVMPDTVLTTPSPSFNTCFNSCPTTSEYNPICGTNRQLYFNQQKFDCAVGCGAQVQVWRRGSCEGLFPMMRG